MVRRHRHVVRRRRHIVRGRLPTVKLRVPHMEDALFNARTGLPAPIPPPQQVMERKTTARGARHARMA